MNTGLKMSVKIIVLFAVIYVVNCRVPCKYDFDILKERDEV